MKKIVATCAIASLFLGCDGLKRDVSPLGNLPTELPEFYVEPGQTFWLFDNFCGTYPKLTLFDKIQVPLLVGVRCKWRTTKIVKESQK